MKEVVMRSLVRRVCIAAIAAMTVASAGCGSPMKMVRPTGQATGSVYSVSGVDLPGTPVWIVTLRNVTSRGVGKYPVTTNESGMFAVAEDVVLGDGRVLIAKGTRVTARVTRKEHTRLARPGWLEIAFLSTQSTSGAHARLDERPVKFTGKSRKPGMIAGAVIVSLLFLLRTGGDVTLQAGSTFVANGSILDLPVTPQ
jgi:hypothetical protein